MLLRVRMYTPPIFTGITYCPWLVVVARSISHRPCSRKYESGKVIDKNVPRTTRNSRGRLTGKAAFQAARSRRAPIENWQHWDWQQFHIGNIPAIPNGGDFAILPASEKQEKKQA